MGTTADKLNKIITTKEAIRTAINNKGGTLTKDDTFASYATAIENIKTGGDNLLQELINNRVTRDNVPCLNYLFAFQTIDTDFERILASVDLSKITNWNSAFYNSIINCPFNIDTSNCTDFSYAFTHTTFKDKVVVDISNATKIDYMFNDATADKITLIDNNQTIYKTGSYIFGYSNNIREVEMEGIFKLNVGDGK